MIIFILTKISHYVFSTRFPWWLMQEPQIQSLNQEDPLEKETATHTSIVAWKSQGQSSLAGYSPWGCKRAGHDLVTKQHQQKCV